MLLIYKGKVLHRQVGALSEPMLIEVIEQFLSVILSNNS
jgi:hypothetical protein